MRALDTTNRVFIITLTVITAAVIALQVPVISEQKDKQYDSTSSLDLSGISMAIESYVTSNNKLPDSLNDIDLDDEIKSRLARYEYSKQLGDAYKLCATFKTKSGNQTTKTDTELDASSFSKRYVDFYSHSAGRVCFEKEVYTYGSGSDSLFDFNTDDFGADGSNELPSVKETENDRHKKVDITNMQGLLEAYFATNASYPTQAQLIDESWVTQNLDRSDIETFRGPNGESFLDVYSYIESPGTCDNTKASPCTAYSLGTKLDNGEYYSKNSVY